MSSLWDSVYSIFTRTRNYLVDPPSEDNPENPELAITEERRGATVLPNQILPLYTVFTARSSYASAVLGS